MNDAAQAEKVKQQDALASERKFYEDAAVQYGPLLAHGIFANQRIEIYGMGYVRVGGYRNLRGGPRRDFTSTDYVISYTTPFEKLTSIQVSTQIQDKSAGGRAVASAASFGLSRMASNEKRLIFLTITTNKQVHALKDGGDMLRTADRVALELESAGKGVIHAAAVEDIAAPPSPVQTSTSLGDQLRDLSALRDAGVLTDEEFAAAKAKLLS